jgi:ribokinase
VTPPVTTVIVVGDLATDVLAVLPTPLAHGLPTGTDTWSTITLTPGGSAANTATWLAGQGRLEVVLVASVGDDSAGDQRLAELAAAGVDCRVRRHPATATGAVIVLSDPTERTMLCDRGANRLLSPTQIDDTLTDRTSRTDPRQPDRADPAHLHLSAYPLFDASSRPAARHALAAARAAGLTTSVDAASAGPLAEAGAPAFLEWTAGADLLIANLDETRVLADLPGDPAAHDPEELAALLRLAGRYRYVVVKLGAGGAVWASEGHTYRCAAEEVVAVDPTGAGDAFAAGLLAAWLGGAGPEEALRAGAALGARAVGTVGARPVAS